MHACVYLVAVRLNCESLLCSALDQQLALIPQSCLSLTHIFSGQNSSSYYSPLRNLALQSLQATPKGSGVMGGWMDGWVDGAGRLRGSPRGSGCGAVRTQREKAAANIHFSLASLQHRFLVLWGPLGAECQSGFGSRFCASCSEKRRGNPVWPERRWAQWVLFQRESRVVIYSTAGPHAHQFDAGLREDNSLDSAAEKEVRFKSRRCPFAHRRSR